MKAGNVKSQANKIWSWILWPGVQAPMPQHLRSRGGFFELTVPKHPTSASLWTSWSLPSPFVLDHLNDYLFDSIDYINVVMQGS
mmetsp:Transcript_24300/g.36855  ORF Transcript_24300/g.36855 Transcript_24300/m.36855 type:complete len:84 (+) Transcript_24300:139-390(+)